MRRVLSATFLLLGCSAGGSAWGQSAATSADAAAPSPESADRTRAFHFENDIVPIFSRFGCNSSGCHGKAEGQNGFKLSVFGFDPAADRAALLQEGRGRRIFPPAPERSLLLMKASGGVPHGGGVRIRRGSGEYRTLRDWIAAGAPAGDPNAPRVVLLEVSPKEQTLAMGGTQQLTAVAVYSDGRRVDVTDHTRFQSNAEALARVDEFGLVTAGDVPGDVAVMAAYMGAVDVFRAIVPRPDEVAPFPPPPTRNFIDELVDAKLRKLNIVPSGMCDDATFLRRAHLDLVGTLPTADETRSFLADAHPERRGRLVDALLQRPEFADYQALKWSDLLRVDRQVLGHKTAFAYYQWIRRSFAENKPWNEFVREIVTAEGPLAEAPAGALYKVAKSPGEMAGTLSQVFLGVRIECAQCHHHPFDRWSQTDYFGMQAYFTPLQFKPAAGGEMLASLSNPVVTHPRSGEAIHAHPLGTANPAESPPGDRRRELAAWMTSPENPWLARAFVNRVWAQLTGRGLVEPVDDFRLTNPPTNPELLDALARRFIESGWNVRELYRTIAASRTYQLSTTPNQTNLRDEQNHSRALLKRLDAEVLLDAICQTTGVPEKFDGVPAGARAIELWDSQVPHYFLKLFGRPMRATPCECERVVEPSVGQVLHVLNSSEIQSKLSHEGGRVAEFLRRWPSPADDEKLLEELYLTFLSRQPTKDERTATLQYLQRHGNRRRQAAEDVAWSLLNSVEFLFNH
ncbi:MAG: DUF1553 domain-containing protein [Planctomycetes bacterium]|nr:DUF1553 domain-containing protein [Planctomycetota bacterium]